MLVVLMLLQRLEVQSGALCCTERIAEPNQPFSFVGRACGLTHLDMSRGLNDNLLTSIEETTFHGLKQVSYLHVHLCFSF